MKITSKGQVTIPQDLRKRFGFLPDTSIEFVPEQGGLRIVKSKRNVSRGRKIAERLAGSGHGKMTTQQIMKLMRG